MACPMLLQETKLTLPHLEEKASDQLQQNCQIILARNGPFGLRQKHDNTDVMPSKCLLLNNGICGSFCETKKLGVS